MPYDLSRLALLIVESDPAVVTTWRRLLTTLKIRDARFVPGVTQAWALLSNSQDDESAFDIVISRWELAGDDGLNLVRRLRRDEASPSPFLPVVLVTQTVTRERVLQALQAGVHEILVLPLAPKAVETRLREIVERPRKFIRNDSYFGPDRRRQLRPGYAGPFRRAVDRD